MGFIARHGELQMPTDLAKWSKARHPDATIAFGILLE